MASASTPAPAPAPAPALVAGVDGCPGGWVVVTASVTGQSGRAVEVVATFGALTARAATDAWAVVGVDMPIGLPEPGQRRTADRDARARLGRRHATVFPTPPRLVLGAATHAEANARCRAQAGRGLSRQSFALVPKIAEVDAVVTPGAAIVEVHPECSFAALAGQVLPPKRTPEGRRARIEALRQWCPEAAAWASTPPRRAGADDVLDACVVSWTAARWYRGEAEVLGDGAVDRRGLPMRIVV